MRQQADRPIINGIKCEACGSELTWTSWYFDGDDVVYQLTEDDTCIACWNEHCPEYLRVWEKVSREYE